MTVNSEEMLLLTLQVAVPLFIHDLSRVGERERIRLARLAVDPILEHGDDMLYGGKECARTFNALARGLAAGAYQPGGVTFAGTHWCTDHTACTRAEEEAACPSTPETSSTTTTSPAGLLRTTMATRPIRTTPDLSLFEDPTGGVE